MKRLALGLSIVLCSILWFSNLEYRKLIRPDEGRYAEIPREMAATGDWVTPRLNGLKYLEKPPLQYWVTAAAYTVFGEHHWTARLWSALSGFLGIWLVGWIGYRMFGPAEGIIAAITVGSCLIYTAIGHMNTLDMGLTLFLTAALGAFMLAQKERSMPNVARRYMLIVWAALGFAFLSKGLIALVIPGGALVIYTLWQRDFGLWRRLHPLPGLLIFVAITAPWIIAVSLRNPEFPYFFFIHEHFGRFALDEHRRMGPIWYFVPVLFAGSLPWTLLWIGALFETWPSLKKGAQQVDKPTDSMEIGTAEFHPQRLLAVWSACIFVFFSLSQSKLMSYILPMYPAMALLFAPAILRMSEGRFLKWMAPTFVLLLAAVIPAELIESFSNSAGSVALYAAFEPWAVGGILALVCGAVFATWLSQWSKRIHGIMAMSFGALLGWQVIHYGHDNFSPNLSSYHLVARISRDHGPFKPAVPFYSIDFYEQTLPFYLKRTVTLVHFRDELGLGLDQEPEKGIPTLEKFAQAWRSDSDAYLIIRPEDLAGLAAFNLPMRELGRDSRRIIFSKR